MYSSYAPLLKTLIDKINTVNSQSADTGLHITMVNLTTPDGKPVTLSWNAEAFDNGDGTFRGDWDITPS